MDRPRAVQAVFGTSLNLFTNGNGQVLSNPANRTLSFRLNRAAHGSARARLLLLRLGWRRQRLHQSSSLQVTNASGSPPCSGRWVPIRSRSQPYRTAMAPWRSARTRTSIPTANGDLDRLTRHQQHLHRLERRRLRQPQSASPFAHREQLITANFASISKTKWPPVFQAVAQIAGGLTFTWSMVTGRAYQVQDTTDLPQTNWRTSGSATHRDK